MGLGASTTIGWLNQTTISSGDTNNFIAGYAEAGTGTYGLVGGGIVISSGGATATVVGVGAGKTVGGNTNIGQISGGYTMDQGKSGLEW